MFTIRVNFFKNHNGRERENVCCVTRSSQCQDHAPGEIFIIDTLVSECKTALWISWGLGAILRTSNVYLDSPLNNWLPRVTELESSPSVHWVENFTIKVFWKIIYKYFQSICFIALLLRGLGFKIQDSISIRKTSTPYLFLITSDQGFKSLQVSGANLNMPP